MLTNESPTPANKGIPVRLQSKVKNKLSGNKCISRKCWPAIVHDRVVLGLMLFHGVISLLYQLLVLAVQIR